MNEDPLSEGHREPHFSPSDRRADEAPRAWTLDEGNNYLALAGIKLRPGEEVDVIERRALDDALDVIDGLLAVIENDRDLSPALARAAKLRDRLRPRREPT